MPLILYLLQLTGVVVVVATYTETSAKANTVIGLTATISNTVMRIARRNGLDWRTKGVLHLTSLTNYHVRSQPPLLMAYSAITIPTSVEASRAFLQGERKLTVTSGLCQGYKRRLDALKPLKYLEQNFVPLANQAFSDVESEATLHEMLRELHDYLLLKYRLLTRVIGARKLHPSRFLR